MKKQQDFGKLKRLSIFATVVEQGSFAAAAKKIGLSRPAVSEQIALLEQQIGCRLLHRTTRKLSLTSDGENLYPKAAEINKAFEQALEITQGEDLQGRVRISTTVDFAIEWLVPKLQEFQQKYPDISVDLISSDRKLDLITEQIDLAVRAGFAHDDQLIARTLRYEPLSIYASPEYLEQHTKINDVADLKEQHWILLTQMYEDGILHLQNKKKDQLIVKPHRFWYCDSPAILISQLEAGLGLGVALPTIVEKAVEQGRLINVLPNWHGGELRISLIYSSRQHIPARVRVLRDFLLA